MKRCIACGKNHSDFVSPENVMAISQMGIQIITLGEKLDNLDSIESINLSFEEAYTDKVA